ncbi:MAG: GntR family transcriptional regulator [Enterocloster bolteae]
MDVDVYPRKQKLKHVKVYNRLYSMIQDGVYPPGSQLPSEPELALQMDVSRMTLRRALALLQEDNLVINIRGEGISSATPISGASTAGPGESHSTRSAVLCPEPLTRQRWNFA